jgi:hypothetical protein
MNARSRYIVKEFIMHSEYILLKMIISMKERTLYSLLESNHGQISMSVSRTFQCPSLSLSTRIIIEKTISTGGRQTLRNVHPTTTS